MMQAFVVFALLAVAVLPPPVPETPDPWAPVRFLVGHFKGSAEGEAGAGTVVRSYEFVLENRYLHERNTSTYLPQEKNPKGEIHRHWSFFSYDRARKLIVLRQFHQEGFVNVYAMLPPAEPGVVVFESEGFENLPAGWKARETYRILSPTDFGETFELAAPGKPFEVYSRTRLRRTE
ncbi:MAG TPA: hypothetical protein VJU18_12230 [Vicinamibacteria bacterium]|nr:hypothetical protein [Vicinamibacteria bacterium]